MTEFFQSLGMSYEWAWGVATVAGILLIALPLMLADRKSTRLNSSHESESRMPSSA